MNRRQFLECAAVIVSGLTASQLGIALDAEQMAYLATAPDYISNGKKFFSGDQLKLVTAVAETIIPRTDTPGATDARVPHFIELMVADWLTDDERQLFMGGLKQMAEQVQAEHGAPFEGLPAETRQKILEDMETAASKSSWYRPGRRASAYVSDAPFICQIKELTVWGFFTSEVGSTQVLRYNVMPMRFDGDVPLAKNEGAWVPVSVR